MRDALPAKTRKLECGVVNLDDDAGPGTHWTAYVKSHLFVIYFDSIGSLQPPTELLRYFRSDGDVTVMYNSERYQNLGSYTCGHLCIRFLYYYAKPLLSSVHL